MTLIYFTTLWAAWLYAKAITIHNLIGIKHSLFLQPFYRGLRVRKSLIKYFTIKYKKFLPVKTLTFIKKDLGLFEAISVDQEETRLNLMAQESRNAHAILYNPHPGPFC